MTPNRDRDVGTQPEDDRPIEGALVELIELEKQIEARIEQAKLQGERVVAHARQRARESEQDGTGSIEEAMDDLRASIESESATRVRALREGAEREAQRYRRIDDAAISRISQWVASRVLQGRESA